MLNQMVDSNQYIIINTIRTDCEITIETVKLVINLCRFYIENILLWNKNNVYGEYVLNFLRL